MVTFFITFTNAFLFVTFFTFLTFFIFIWTFFTSMHKAINKHHTSSSPVPFCVTLQCQIRAAPGELRQVNVLLSSPWLANYGQTWHPQNPEVHNISRSPLPEENRATATGDIITCTGNLVEIGNVVRYYRSMPADRQTDTLIAILRCPTRGEVTNRNDVVWAE